MKSVPCTGTAHDDRVGSAAAIAFTQSACAWSNAVAWTATALINSSLRWLYGG
ncbi:hypothetical protein BFL36_01230 [Clavibacter michiganensis]|uniref:Uncharacterized protein n=1 Tax=Clavibacter michiganensis TaxID=28447 RepID=A0A251YWE9_9MICO|nr:hypothetical protein BFL36_01230 [Clavibacter michiganensis]